MASNEFVKRQDNLYKWFYKNFGNNLKLVLKDDPNYLTAYNEISFEIYAPEIWPIYKCGRTLYLGEHYKQRRLDNIYKALRRNIAPIAKSLNESISKEKKKRGLGD